MESKAAHPVRISSGKIKTYVTFALDFIDKNEDTPLVFHTLPHEHQKEPEQGPETPPIPAPAPATTPAPAPTSSKFVTSTIPRLITVVEIVKREYLKNLALKRSPRLTGLHQYNEMGCLEDLPRFRESWSSSTADEALMDGGMDERARHVIQTLSGKNHIKKQRTPYMKITLSQTPLPLLEEQGATYQPPMTRTLSKSAKSRAKKRERKQQVGGEVKEGEEEDIEEDGSDNDMSE